MEEDQAFDISLLEPTSEAEQDPKAILPLLSSSEQVAPPRPTTPATDATEAAKGALISSKNPEDALGTYKLILAEMQGPDKYSKSLENIKEGEKRVATDMAKLGAANALVDGAFDPLPSGVHAARPALDKVIDQINQQTLDQNFAIDSASKYVPQARDVADVGVGAIVREIEAKQFVQREMNKVVTEFSPNFGAFSAGVAQSVLPFIESEQTRRLYEGFAANSELDGGKAFKTYLASGHAKKELRSLYDDLLARDPEAAKQLAVGVLGTLRDDVGIIYENDFAALNRMRELLGFDDEEYANWEMWLDDAGGVLDVAGLGFTARVVKRGIKAPIQMLKDTKNSLKQDAKIVSRFLKGGRPEDIAAVKARKTRMEKARADAIKNSAIDSTAPVAPANIAADYNPTQARAMTEMAMADDEAALAMFGTKDKGDIGVRMYAPSIRDADGGIANRIQMNDSDPLADIINQGNVMRLSEEEVASIEKNVAKSFSADKPGLTLNTSMTTIDTPKGSFDIAPGVKSSSQGDSIKISAAFKVGGDAAELSPKAMMDYVEWAFRDRGLSQDNVGLFKRVGDRWVEVDKNVSEIVDAKPSPIKTSWEEGPVTIKPTEDDKLLGGTIFDTPKVKSVVDRPSLPEEYSVGPSSVKTKPNTSALFSEMDGERFDSVMRASGANHKGDSLKIWMAKNPDLALGQGDNKGIKVKFRVGGVSGETKTKPGTFNDETSEFLSDFIGKDSIDEVVVQKGIKLSSLTKRFLSNGFVKSVDQDGVITYSRDLPKDSPTKGTIFGQTAQIDDVFGATTKVGQPEDTFGEAFVPKAPTQADRARTLSSLEMRNNMKKKLAGKPTTISDEIDDAIAEARTPEYMVVIKHEEKALLSDADAMTSPDIRNNFLDRVFANYTGPSLADMNWGSLQSHLFDAASMFKSKFINRAASNAVDKTSKLEQLMLRDAKQFSKTFDGLDKAEKNKFGEWIIKADREGLKLDPAQARIDGWTDRMLSAHAQWRAQWDRVYVLENADKVKTEKSRGSSMWVRPETGESQLVKVIPPNQMNKHFEGGLVEVYDSSTETFKKMSYDEVKAWRDNGGSFVETRRPVQTENGVIRVILSDDKPGKSYTRAIRDDEKLLDYREGYFARNYKDEYFIRKSIVDDKGKHLYWKAVGSARSAKEAEVLNRKFYQFDKDAKEGTYVIGKDIKGSDAHADAMHDLNTARGRSAQRMRGEELKKDLSADSFEMSTTANPMEALVHSIRSISRRTSMRDWIETSKTRAMKRYSHLYPRDPNTTLPMYPSKASDIRNRDVGLADEWEIADARTLFNYIRSMEDGYTNLIDDGWKGLLNFTANTLAPYSSIAERAVRAVADSKGIVAASRSVTASLVLFSHTFRQLVVQPMQSLQLIGVMHPVWTFGQSMPQMAFMISKYAGIDVSDKMLKLAGWTREEYNTVFKAFDSTGQLAAVDKQNLVRGVLGDMADRATASTFRKVLTSPIHIARRAGIDTGEMVNSLVTYLAFADQAKRAGKSLADPRVAEEVSSAARNFSGNMNEAGDLPYNHNIFSIPMQFAQIGHKMIMNMTFNQHLTGWQKTRLGLTNLAVFGIPMQAMYEKGIEPKLPEDMALREVVKEGLLNWAANESINMAFDSDTRLDIAGSASPFSSSLLTTIYGFISTDIMTTLSKSPSGGLIFGGNPRIQTFVNELSQWIVPKPDMAPADYRTVAIAGAKMFSGASAAFKSAYIFQTGQTLTAKGVTSDYKADYVAAVAAIFGIRTEDEVKMAAFNTLNFQDKEYKEDIKKTYDIFARQVALHGSSTSDPESIKQGFAIGLSIYGSTPEFWNEWQNHVNKGAKRGDFSALEKVYEGLGTRTIDDSIARLRMIPKEQLTPDIERIIEGLEKMKVSRGEE